MAAIASPFITEVSMHIHRGIGLLVAALLLPLVASAASDAKRGEKLVHTLGVQRQGGQWCQHNWVLTTE